MDTQSTKERAPDLNTVYVKPVWKKKTFIVTVVCVAVIAVALGVGLGVGLRGKGQDNETTSTDSSTDFEPTSEPDTDYVTSPVEDSCGVCGSNQCCCSGGYCGDCSTTCIAGSGFGK